MEHHPSTSTTTLVPTGLVDGFNHAVVVTADLDRFCAFYAGVFGAEVGPVPAPPPATRGALVRLGTTAAFNAVEVPGAPAAGDAAPLARGHIDHVAFGAPDAAALEELRRRLVARGACDGTVADYGALVCVPFTDPDGMATEVCWLRDPALRDLRVPQHTRGPVTP